MIVGSKESLGPCSVMNVLDNSLSQSHSIIGSRPAPQLIKENERTIASLPNGPVGLHHLHHKGRLPGNQIIRCPDSSENRIKNRETSRFCRYIGTHLCHDDDDG